VLPAETRALVISKAEGNPYYIEELILSLIEQQVLVQDVWSGEWRATRAVASLDLPDSVQSLLLARIDSLPLETRRVLQMMAVIGPVFWFDVLQSIASNEVNLRQQLTFLQKAQFILEQGQVADLGMEYAFKSKLIRDVAYDSILTSQRNKYHKQIGDYLEQKIGAEVPPQYFGMLAYHYRQAEEPGKELFYHQLAAQQARNVYANEEALGRYNRILVLLDKLETQTADASRLYTLHGQRFEVLNQRREVHLTIGNFEAARTDAQALLPLARRYLADDPIWLIDALLQQPGVANWTRQEELEIGLPLAEEALALSRQIGDQERELQSLIAIALQQLDLDDALALNFAEQALSLARQLGNTYYEARILINMSGIYNWSNRPERSEAYLKAALPLFETLDDKIAESELLGQIAIHLERQGDYFRLLTEFYQKKLQISRDIGHKPLESKALRLCGQVQGIYLGKHEAGLTLLEESLRLQQNYPEERFSWLHMVQIYVDLGEYQVAREALDHAYQIRVPELQEIAHVGAYLVSAILHNSLGDEASMYRALEDLNKVERLVAERRHITRQFEMAAACESARAHLSLAQRVSETAERAARRQQALAASQKALAIYERFGFTQIVECVSEKIFFHHSQALAANSHQSEASHFLQRAYAEMMRKHDLIPANSPFRDSFLKNISLHRQIQSAYQANLQLAYKEE
jgi:predicted ATPase